MKILLDTHIWVWSHLEPERLGRRLRSILLDPANELWLSPISLWEFLLLVERGRITITDDPGRWIDTACSHAPMHEAPVTNAVARRSRAIRVPHDDPADRFLAATAQVYDLVLATDDRHILRGTGYQTLGNR